MVRLAPQPFGLMKVLLIGNYAPDAQESMLRFAALLEGELRAAGHSVQLLQPRARFNRNGGAPEGVAKWLGYLDKFAVFPPILRRAARRADIVHICDHSNAPYVRFLGQTPNVVTCHDVLAIRSALGLVPQNPTGASGRVLQNFILRGLNRAQFVVCVSQNTLRQLRQISTLVPARLDVILVGFNYPYSPMPGAQAQPRVRALLKQMDFDQPIPPYILHVGGDQWYKNRDGVLAIYSELRHQMGERAPHLIMAGRPFTNSMKQLIKTEKIKNVTGVSNISNEDLRALYSLAQLFIFPSLAEGFGWPVIEAQACGARVLTSDFQPLTEVGGDAAFYADPHDEPAFARAIAALLEQDEAAKSASVEAGFENVARFAPQHMTDAYLQTYQKVIDRNGKFWIKNKK